MALGVWPCCPGRRTAKAIESRLEIAKAAIGVGAARRQRERCGLMPSQAEARITCSSSPTGQRDFPDGTTAELALHHPKRSDLTGSPIQVGSRALSLPLVLLFLTAALNIFDRQIINVLAQDIKTELSISDAALGVLTGSAFGLFYSLLGVPLGRLADRMNRVTLIASAILLWSLFTGAGALAVTFAQFALARVGVGVGEAGSQPASTSLVADLFPEGRRNTAMSIMLAGAPVGSCLGLLVGGYVGSIWGWRAALLLAALPGVVVAGTVILTMRDPSAPNRRLWILHTRPEGHASSFVGAMRTLLGRRGFLWLACGASFGALLTYSTAAWLPVFFIRVHHMTSAQIGAFAGVASGVGGVFGTFGAGMFCDYLRQFFHRVEAKVIVAAVLLSVPSLLVTVLCKDRNIALGAMFLLNLCVYAPLAPTVRLAQAAATSETRALAIGTLVTVGNVFGLTLGVPMVGALSDALAGRSGADSIRFALAACAIAGCVSSVAYWRAGRTIEC